ncbi:MAG TPA: uridine diphosphate-N-acetylglucosamine-binding protein YvcK [Synergistales bacterium]|nr:uridine diphosphate-N-acetylglucosamine-binding protein YvcK [Synergistales bacterium]
MVNLEWLTPFGIGILIGGFAVMLWMRRSIRNRRGLAEIMSSAIGYRLAAGPRVVALGGGTGLSTLLKGLKAYTRNITAIVTVTDEGGSSGRLRTEWGVLPPGDVRNCIIALAENDSALNRILSFRFNKGELAGHSLGNLVLLAATELAGDFRLAVEEMNKLLAIRGRVLPVTTEAVTIAGVDAKGNRYRGELDVARHGRELTEVHLEPSDARPLQEVVESIREAEVIVLGPGSLFTSILPNLLVQGVAEAIRRAEAPRIYVANVMTQPGETDGFSVYDHVRWIKQVLGQYPDIVMVNETEVPKDILQRYRETGSEPVILKEREEVRLAKAKVQVIRGDFLEITPEGLVRHQTQRVSEAIMKVAREAKELGR